MDNNLQKYQTFISTVDCGSFTKAAAILGYAQSYIHNSIPVAVMLCTVVVATFAVMMVSMMVTMSIRVIFQCSCSKSFCGLVRQSLNTGIEFNPSISHCHLSTHTDAATDQRIYLCCLQETGQCTMSTSIRVYNLFSYDLAVLSIIQFELFGMSEVLKNFPAFISNCDSHCATSFLHNDLMKLNRLKFTASSCDQQPFSMNKSIRDLFSRAFIDCCNCGTSNIHSGSTCFLCEPFIIQKT